MCSEEYLGIFHKLLTGKLPLHSLFGVTCLALQNLLDETEVDGVGGDTFSGITSYLPISKNPNCQE